MQDRLSYPLDADVGAQITDVGGKAISLIRLTAAGFPVPRGVVLSTSFFDPWLREIGTWEEWAHLQTAVGSGDTDAVRELDATIAGRVEELTYSPSQMDLISTLGVDFKELRLAVRSSSPEEDLEGASFAGLYETLLDVTVHELEDAVRSCFRSCLDSRVMIYKRQMGLQNLTPRIAVVIQELCDSDVSGVAFSLNPVSNDFDEMMVNASWGLGEALVSGELTPDSYVVSKPDGNLLEVSLGDKGGDRPDDQSLSLPQLHELNRVVSSLEHQYGEPVDVEWAYANGELMLLQARPITTYIPLPESMQTEPGEQRILYLDPALADGLTLSGPIPRMTLDVLVELLRQGLFYVFGEKEPDLNPKTGVMGIGGARVYVNLSNLLHLFDPGKVAELRRMLDNTLADIYLMIDRREYQAEKPPAYLKLWRVIGSAPRICWKCWPFIRGCLRAWFKRDLFDAEYNVELIRFEQQLATIDSSLPLQSFLDRVWSLFAVVSARVTFPALVIFIAARERIASLGGRERAELVDRIQAGGDDLVHQMGLELYSLSKLLTVDDFRDVDELALRLGKRQLPIEFLNAWDKFQSRFACRGALEMDLSRQKYGDDPVIALRQIAMMAGGDDEFDPREVHATQKAARQQGYETLRSELSGRKQRALDRAFLNMTQYEPSREMPKHHLVMVNYRIRERLLREAETLVKEGRLDSHDEIFELSVSDLIRAANEPDYDLRAIIGQADPAYRHGMKHVRHFPHVMDSRGRIMRPQKSGEPGHLQGMGVSPGVVTGRVKVLHDPYEKTIEPGDVLVAYTTDPGWTPLFVNATAVLLEVGGQLQHGALVAREYGKPCVAGILDVTVDLQDGQLVEVDGSAGRVRVLADPQV